MPLRTRGMTRSWVLEQRDGTLVSTGHLMCGFVPMRGAGEHRGASVPLLGDGVVGLWQDEGDAIAAEELAGVLNGPGHRNVDPRHHRGERLVSRP